MNDIFVGIAFLAWVLTFFSFGIGILTNIWINYSCDKTKHPFFPILNPFSISSYQLMINSMFKLTWKSEGGNKKLKHKSNKLRKFSGIMLLVTIGFGILSLITA